MTTALSHFKTHLSAHLARIKKGQEIVVTDRGVPVARVIPFQEQGLSSEQLKVLVREGAVRAPAKKLHARFREPSPFKDSKSRVLHALLSEREDDR